MRKYRLIIIAIIFFIIVNTIYYWDSKLGFFAMPVTLILFVVYFGLLFGLIRQIYFAIREKFIKRYRIVVMTILTILLVATFLKPFGLIDFEKFEGNDLLIAQREGAANCMTTLKLKENNEFKERSVCFGVTEITGNYEFRNDTIFFSNIDLGRYEDEYFEFAIIEPSMLAVDTNSYDLVRYKNQRDTIGCKLWITKNELKKIKK